jgi:hypothetical protein
MPPATVAADTGHLEASALSSALVREHLADLRDKAAHELLAPTSTRRMTTAGCGTSTYADLEDAGPTRRSPPNLPPTGARRDRRTSPGPKGSEVVVRARRMGIEVQPLEVWTCCWQQTDRTHLPPLTRSKWQLEDAANLPNAAVRQTLSGPSPRRRRRRAARGAAGGGPSPATTAHRTKADRHLAGTSYIEYIIY